ncbi:hypothetical protein [Streptomyces sp. NBC_01443]|uniref:hypothetical protein n=1 Tax=Streptomyces sp. NBC_01443 TaxID=2903868 RepID=UPI00224F0A33|nr:hypothetical protein [Streptomyces sp. NBC_01443]MCX4632181.1 hypothetical protein [Streptomyces sp. NBC_01443]
MDRFEPGTFIGSGTAFGSPGHGTEALLDRADGDPVHGPAAGPAAQRRMALASRAWSR